jgi:hypothetical protein
MMTEDGNDVTQEFIDYARPLIGDLPPIAHLHQVLSLEP